MWRTSRSAATVTAAALGGVLALTLSGPAGATTLSVVGPAGAQATPQSAPSGASVPAAAQTSRPAASVAMSPLGEPAPRPSIVSAGPGQTRSEWHVVADTAADIEGDGHTSPTLAGTTFAAAAAASPNAAAAATPAAAVASTAVTPAANRAFWAFALLAPNAPTKAVRWNPCRTITWVWPGSTARDRYWMTRSMQAVSVYSGMSF
ncbi:MAG: hypothetical protein QG597_4524, partial [Actinomycetota bacterium]|nr:hypothetical protein [Actinomycetota bacterium]